MKVTEDTKRVAQKAIDYIDMHPENHDQAAWFHADRSMGSPSEKNMCGTTMCVAGTAIFLEKGLRHLIEMPGGYSELGAELLGLDGEETNALFFEFDNEYARDALRAIAAGDENKFKEISKTFYETL